MSPRIESIESINPDGTTSEHIIVWHNETEFTSMPKSVWDELEAQKELGGTL